MVVAGDERYVNQANSVRFGPSTEVDGDGNISIDLVYFEDGTILDFTSSEFYINIEDSQISSLGVCEKGKIDVSNLSNEAEVWIRNRLNHSKELSIEAIRSSTHPEQTEKLLDACDSKSPFFQITLDHQNQEGRKWGRGRHSGGSGRQDNDISGLEMMVARMDNKNGTDRNEKSVAFVCQQQLLALHHYGFDIQGK